MAGPAALLWSGRLLLRRVRDQRSPYACSALPAGDNALPCAGRLLERRLHQTHASKPQALKSPASKAHPEVLVLRHGLQVPPQLAESWRGCRVGYEVEDDPKTPHHRLHHLGPAGLAQMRPEATRGLSGR